MAKSISKTTSVISFLCVLSAFMWLIWSYGLVDRNLTLSGWTPLLQWQQWSWAWSKSAPLVTTTFVALALLWAGLLSQTKKLPLAGTKIWWLVVTLLALGQNALSHDLFNYLFNAKMVLLYHVNPHVSVALDFPTDAWLRFMHNVHTPAPYAYGWTALSLIPSFLSGQKFLIDFLFMRAWMVLGLVLTVWAFRRLVQATKTDSRWITWLAWQPLLLIETVMNSHNDVWMMWPALLAFSFLFSKPTWKKIGMGVGLILLSASIKYVTILLLPVFLGYFLMEKYLLKTRIQKFLHTYWADISVALMMIPLFTARSQQFHPWYLIWALCFVPFARTRVLRFIVQGLAVTSLLRYIPWLWFNGEYNETVYLWSKIITWSGAVFGVVAEVVSRFRK